MTELQHSLRAARSDAPQLVVDAIAELDPCDLALSSQESEYVWVAAGLKRRWRVVSELRTFGEWDRLADAYGFLGLLLEGNPNLRRFA